MIQMPSGGPRDALRKLLKMLQSKVSSQHSANGIARSNFFLNASEVLLKVTNTTDNLLTILVVGIQPHFFYICTT
jgi:hypothetical protein